MSKKLEENIYRMHNAELIGLAKNRFLPENVQMAIAKNPYARAHWYLAENDGLSDKVRDYLWSDDCNRGYSLKTLLLTYGHFTQDPEKYRELYNNYPSAWTRSPWRMISAFVGSYWRRQGANECPSDILTRIYDERMDPKLYKNSLGYHSRHGLETLAKHKNVDLPLAIKLSQCGVESVQKLGFQKIVLLSQ